MKRVLTHCLRKVLPAPSYLRLQQIYHRTILRLWYFGFAHYCPICRSHLRTFIPSGIKPHVTPQNLCPVCASQQRHRLLWLFLTQRTTLFSLPQKRMLHAAPEFCFDGKFSKHPAIHYISADLFLYAMIRMDLTQICFPNSVFDVIYASHVLEHILDDRSAMRELYRVLKPDGWAILQVPLGGTKLTYEDPSITTPEERECAFGQADHVRIYGEDYYKRLQETGFIVERKQIIEQQIPRYVKRLGLPADEHITFCRKSP